MSANRRVADGPDDRPPQGLEPVRGGSDSNFPATNLTGDHFTLRPFQQEHISPRLLAWLNNPAVNQFLEVRFTPQTHATALAYMKTYYGETQKYMWGIFPEVSDNLIGTVTLHDINRIHGVGEVGLLIGDTDYWGKGASNEVLETVLSFAFESLGLRRVTGGSYALNQGMNFTFKRLGFTFEGKQREAWYISPGVYTDGYRWGILASEWRAWHQQTSAGGE